MQLEKWGIELEREITARIPKAQILWPDYPGSAEGRFRFLTECWYTWNESDQRIGLVPKKEYIEQFCYDWHDCFTNRKALIVEKSRRLLLSWVCRGLECHEMGLGRGEWHIVDQTHENSAQQLWRVHFSLKELASRRPELKLKPHKAYGSIERKEVTDIVLPNGSIFTQGFQEAGADQGKGKTGVTLEEVSKYRQPSAFWAQSLIITMGEAGSKGGWVCGIANSSPNPDWRDIKGKLSARKLLGLE